MQKVKQNQSISQANKGSTAGGDTIIEQQQQLGGGNKSLNQQHNRSSTFLPSIDQSTAHSTANLQQPGQWRAQTHKEKRIPKMVLKELQSENDSDFFMTNSIDQSMKRANSSENIRFRQLMPIAKKKKQVDIILDDLRGAVQKLKNIKFQKSRIAGIGEQGTQDSDSSGEDNNRQSAQTKRLTSKRAVNISSTSNVVGSSKTPGPAQQQASRIPTFASGGSKKNASSYLARQLPDPDVELREIMHKTLNKTTMNQTGSVFLYAHSVQENRQEQILGMQNTLKEGLSKYNFLVKEIERRNKVLAGLQENVEKCDSEINTIQRMKQTLFEGTDETSQQLHNFEEQYDQALMEGDILANMKQNKYKDVQLLRKRVDEIKKVRDEFDKFLFKEVESLVTDTKQLDAIRSSFSKAQLEKNQMEDKLQLALNDHQIIRANEGEVIKYMELEQAAQEQLEKARKEEQQAKHQQEREEQVHTRQQIAQERAKLTELEEQFNRLKLKISAVNSIYEIMPYVEEAKETNSFCKQKKQDLIILNNELRQQIKESTDRLEQERSGSLQINTDNQLMNEIENIGIEGKEIELEQVRWEAEKAKKDDEFAGKLVENLKRSMHNLLLTMASSKIEKNQDIDRNTNNSVEELSLRLIRGIRNIQEALDDLGFSEEQLEQRLDIFYSADQQQATNQHSAVPSATDFPRLQKSNTNLQNQNQPKQTQEDQDESSIDL